MAEPGWYQDPENPTVNRFYDGQQWTERRQPKNESPAAGMASAQSFGAQQHAPSGPGAVNPDSPFASGTSDFSAAAFGKAGSNGFTRIGLFVGTNIAMVATFSILAAAIGLDPVGIGGMAVFACVLGMGSAFFSLAMSKKIAIRATRCRLIESPVDEGERWLFDRVQDLSSRAGIGMPDVAIFPDNAANAFATGAKRDDALVAVSTGLLTQMDASEIEAVLAHEIAHVANGDMITSTLLQGVLNTIVIFVARIVALPFRRIGRFAYFLAYMAIQFVLGFFASMIVTWFSRRREYRADAGAAMLVGPGPMIAALQSLQGDNVEAELPDKVAAFGIRNSSRKNWVNRVLSTHPALEDRISKLQQGPVG